MKETTRIVFSGDISFSKYFSTKETTEFIAPDVLAYLRNSDCTVMNVESPFTSTGIDSNRALNHVSAPEKALILKDMGNAVWSLGNNHILDCQFEGMKDTKDAAERVGAATIGAGLSLEEAAKPYIVGDETKVGVLVVTKPWSHLSNKQGEYYAIPWTLDEYIREAVSQLRKKVRWVVLIVHGGDEFAAMPLPYLRKRYHKLLSYGADVIVGHHPHVVENYESVGEKKIFYSLGNFIFDTDYQRAQKYSDVGILLGLNFTPETIEFDYLPVKNDRRDNCIVVTEKPAIFSDIQPKEYRLLWPLAAAKYFCANIVAEKIKKTNVRQKPFWWFVYRDIRSRQRGLVGERVLGFFISKLGLHLLSKDKDVVRYLREQI